MQRDPMEHRSSNEEAEFHKKYSVVNKRNLETTLEFLQCCFFTQLDNILAEDIQMDIAKFFSILSPCRAAVCENSLGFEV